MSHPGCLHGSLQMFCPENGVCNYLALQKINHSKKWNVDSSDSRFFCHLNYKVCMLFT